jgi:hypothetical protein
MQAFYLTLFLLLSLLGFGSAGNPNCAPEVPDCIISDDPDSPDYADFVNPLPDTMTVICTGHKVDDEARIKTMARMMDWSVHHHHPITITPAHTQETKLHNAVN